METDPTQLLYFLSLLRMILASKQRKFEEEKESGFHFWKV